MLAAVLAGFVAAGLAPPLVRLRRRLAGWVLAAVPASLGLYFATHVPAVADGEAVVRSYAWVPDLGVTLSLSLDGLSALFALLICGMGTLTVVYAQGSLGGHPGLGRFYALLLLFMAAMLGVVLAGNILTLYVFWELTSVASYLLIGFDHHRAVARTAALQALLVTTGGGFALLAGLLLLGHVGGSYELAALMESGTAVHESSLYPAVLLLILLGAATKSAQVPFHFWLPNAMEAPTPVSAYLHSATMVKAGVYLLARLLPILGGTATWSAFVGGVGAATMLTGAVLALLQTDLKRILAYSTVSALGTLVLLLGIGSVTAALAAVTFLLAHALYKGALFFVAGAVDHETGTRDVREVGGFGRAMPLTALGAAAAVVSMAGLPPLLGFVGKELALEAALSPQEGGPLLGAATAVASSCLTAAALLAGVRPFVGRPRRGPNAPGEAPPSLWTGPLLLGALGLVLGLAPDAVAGPAIRSAAAAATGVPVTESLELWHGETVPLLLSGVAAVAGAVLYVRHDAVLARRRALRSLAVLGPARWYGAALAGLNRLAWLQTRVLQSGSLRWYVLATIGTTAALGWYTFLTRGMWDLQQPATGIRLYEAVAALVIVLGALAAVLSNNWLTAVASLGVVGYGIALVYLMFGAPDLAMTQFLVETLTVILFVLVFYHLPRFAPLSSVATRLRDGAVALVAGGLMAALVAAVATHPHTELAAYFADQSVPAGHGRNVLNVILVDFRALDTLGEITVLAVAAFGVYALLRFLPGEKRR